MYRMQRKPLRKREIRVQNKELTVKAVIDNYIPAADFVEEVLEAHCVPAEIQAQICVALDELYSNVINYGYADREPGEVTVRLCFDEEKKELQMIIEDDGIPFDPTRREAPDVLEDADTRQIGGLGIHMVREMMDEMIYEYREGRNVLRIRKKY